jgi:hypothetical protein
MMLSSGELLPVGEVPWRRAVGPENCVHGGPARVGVAEEIEWTEVPEFWRPVALLLLMVALSDKGIAVLLKLEGALSTPTRALGCAGRLGEPFGLELYQVVERASGAHVLDQHPMRRVDNALPAMFWLPPVLNSREAGIESHKDAAPFERDELLIDKGLVADDAVLGGAASRRRGALEKSGS